MFICYNKAKELGGYYKAIGVGGPIYAYFTVVCSLGGAFMIVFGPVSGFLTTDWTDAVGKLIAGLILFLVGFFMFKRAYKKCPADLRRRFLLNLVIMMLGVGIRISLFFAYWIFKINYELNKPDYYVDQYGNRYEAHPFTNELFDPETGFKIGVLNGDGTITRV